MLSRFLLLENSLHLKNALDLRDLVILALTHCGKEAGPVDWGGCTLFTDSGCRAGEITASSM